jgi:hypothetical protein
MRASIPLFKLSVPDHKHITVIEQNPLNASHTLVSLSEVET